MRILAIFALILWKPSTATSVLSDYIVEAKVFSDEYVQVLRVASKSTSEKYTLQIVTKSQFAPAEVSALRRETFMRIQFPSHPNIVTLKKAFEGEKYIFRFFELCELGNWMSELLPRLSEMQAREYFRHLIEALRFLRSQSVVHRSITPYSIWIDGSGNVKISDMTMAIKIVGRCRDSRREGCPLEYTAPEVFEQKDYSFEIDVWSAGITLHEMLFGEVPFKAAGDEELVNRITGSMLEFPRNIQISVQAQDLLTRMLEKDPVRRISIEGILIHPWLTEMDQAKAEELQRDDYVGAAAWEDEEEDNPVDLFIDTMFCVVS